MKTPCQTQEEASKDNLPVLIFVHGMYHGPWCWRHFKEFFDPRGYECDPVALRGHEEQRSCFRLFFARLSDFAHDVEAAAGKHNRPVVLVGHSMGALAVIRAAEIVKPAGIILLAPASTRSFREANVTFFLNHPCRSLLSFVTGYPRFAILNPFVCKELFFSPEMLDADLKENCRSLQNESLLATAQMLAGSWAGCPTYQPFGDTPVLVLGAKRDKSVSIEALDEIATSMGTKADPVPDVAHDMMLDCNWESVAKVMLVWLDNTFRH